ncbi:GNAT family N-acetyltransferase [Serinibacter salmoneus]|uniref:Mycothiol synthase n=1 Tax=Serinibacter salmoneus TaxID=556530 RepID=A0A2A9D256_9MICO|nr:GNAT family N-acetyltransferase [Serinibacter salmoneus]PFG19939.1 mycothiol synthase [Serinibacter salmoneus]
MTTMNTGPTPSPALLPLRERIAAPAAPVPAHPDVAVWRAARLEDAAAVTAAIKAMDAVDHPDWSTPQEDVVDELTSARLDLATDSLVAVDAQGAVLAVGLVPLHPGTDRVQVRLSGGVIPAARRRGIGTALGRWQVARALERLAQREEAVPAWIRLTTEERTPGWRALPTTLGFQIARWFTSMDRDLADPPPPARVPEGVRLVPLTPQNDAATMAAVVAAFQDHWGSAPIDAAEWHQTVRGEFFRDDLTFVAVPADAGPAGPVLGAAITIVTPEDFPLQGYTSSYLATLGVTRQARGKGVASALLAAVLGATAEAGLERVVLDVDTDSPTGALGLYERAGFVASSRSATWVLEV